MSKINWLDRSIILVPFHCLVINEKQFHQALKHLHVSRNQWPDFLKTSHSNATAHFLNKEDLIDEYIKLTKKKPRKLKSKRG